MCTGSQPRASSSKRPHISPLFSCRGELVAFACRTHEPHARHVALLILHGVSRFFEHRRSEKYLQWKPQNICTHGRYHPSTKQNQDRAPPFGDHNFGVWRGAVKLQPDKRMLHKKGQGECVTTKQGIRLTPPSRRVMEHLKHMLKQTPNAVDTTLNNLCVQTKPKQQLCRRILGQVGARTGRSRLGTSSV